MNILQESFITVKASQSCLIFLFVLLFGITRFKIVESFSFHQSLSSTSFVTNVLQEKISKPAGFVGRLYKRSIDDCRSTKITSSAIRYCARISSVGSGGHSWGVTNKRTFSSVKATLGDATWWFVWKVSAGNRTVYLFGLESEEQLGKYHFIRSLRNKKLVLSEPQNQPGSNFQVTDLRCFEIFSSKAKRGSLFQHVATKLFVTDKNSKRVRLTKKRKPNLARKYRLMEIHM